MHYVDVRVSSFKCMFCGLSDIVKELIDFCGPTIFFIPLCPTLTVNNFSPVLHFMLDL